MTHPGESAISRKVANNPGGSGITHTSTYTTLFDTKMVDRLLGAAHHELESDFQRRAEYVSKPDHMAIEARLAMLRAVWTLLLDRSQQ